MYFKDVKARISIWAVAALAFAALVPATASGQDYGSEQQAMNNPTSCGHLGTSCDDGDGADGGARVQKRARKSCKRTGRSARRSKRSGVRAYAALPRSSKRSRKGRCGRTRS